MNVFVTGGNGQLGSDILKQLKINNINFVAPRSKELDITNEEDIKNLFYENNFDAVIHTAAWTKVDDAEIYDNKKNVYNINVLGTKNIVNMCKIKNIPLMYFSTDYVFGGEGNEPYKINDKINPLGYYAKTKYEGEELVKTLEKYFIIRISWVFGKNGNNFIKTMLKLSETKNELKVVNDQIGSPTYTVDLSKLVVDMIKTNKYGIYHATNEGYVSWADFAREIFKQANKDVKIINVTTEEYGAKAKRPKNSRLDKSELIKNGFSALPIWQDALKRFLIELDNN